VGHVEEFVDAVSNVDSRRVRAVLAYLQAVG